MLEGANEVRAAVALLGGAEKNLPDRMLLAASQWWRALSHCQAWPAMLRGKADCIAGKLLEHGSLQMSIAAMDDQQLLDLAGDLKAFAKDMESEAGMEFIGSGAGNDVYIAYPFH